MHRDRAPTPSDDRRTEGIDAIVTDVDAGAGNKSQSQSQFKCRLQGPIQKSSPSLSLTSLRSSDCIADHIHARKQPAFGSTSNFQGPVTVTFTLC